MSTIKTLLNDSFNPQAQLMAQTRGLVKKWEKTGLLEGLGNQTERSNMSIILENQAKQLIDEATRTGTSANSEQWAGVALPLVRRVFAEISAKEFVSVQPMNLPSGLVFYLDFKYGSNQPGRPAFVSQSLFGGTGLKLGSTDSAVNGLYGVARYGYSVNDLFSSSIAVVSATPSTFADVGFDANFSASQAAGNLYTVTINMAAADPNYDTNGIRSFVVQSTGSVTGSINDYYPNFTRSTTPGYVTFVVSGSAQVASASLAPTALSVSYTRQPTDDTRGDFEDKATPITPANNGGAYADIGIPEINLELKSEAIVAKTRKLKAVWTPELAQDFNAYHSIDAEAELTALLSEYVSMEIDLEILDMLIENAVTIEYWSAFIGNEINPSKTAFVQTATNASAYNKGTWFQTLGNKIQKVSNKIHQLTLRGGANFIVCSPDIATILESIPGYSVNTDGDQAKFAMGVSKVGNLSNRWQVYKNPYMVENILLVGFRGTNFLETGAVYAPYVPLIQTPLVYDPINFTPRRGVMTRYAKKMVRPEFYAKVYVGDLNYV
jgi:hypothetical protein